MVLIVAKKKLKVYKPSSSYTYNSSSDSFDDDSLGDSDENEFDDFSTSKVHPSRPRNYCNLRVDLHSNKSRKMKKSRNSGDLDSLSIYLTLILDNSEFHHV